jgi:hypothetical protein
MIVAQAQAQAQALASHGAGRVDQDGGRSMEATCRTG